MSTTPTFVIEALFLIAYGREQERLMFCIRNHSLITVGTHKKHVIMSRNNHIIPFVNVIPLHIPYSMKLLHGI